MNIRQPLVALAAFLAASFNSSEAFSYVHRPTGKMRQRKAELKAMSGAADLSDKCSDPVSGIGGFNGSNACPPNQAYSPQEAEPTPFEKFGHKGQMTFTEYSTSIEKTYEGLVPKGNGLTPEGNCKINLKYPKTEKGLGLPSGKITYNNSGGYTATDIVEEGFIVGYEDPAGKVHKLRNPIPLEKLIEEKKKSFLLRLE